MTQDELKALVAQAAIHYVEPGSVIGVGTGSTVNHFIDALARMPVRIAAAVSSSEQTSVRLRAHGFEVRDAAIASGWVTAAEFDAWVRPEAMVRAGD